VAAADPGEDPQRRQDQAHGVEEGGVVDQHDGELGLLDVDAADGDPGAEGAQAVELARVTARNCAPRPLKLRSGLSVSTLTRT
jgi:hypothetical protein